MPTYGRVVGLLSLTGLLGLLVVVHGANARQDPCRGEPAVPHACPPDPIGVGVPLGADTVKVHKATKSKESKAAQREALIAQLLPILGNTHSAAVFMMTLEALVTLDAPVEKVVPVCLRAMENLDKFKPLPTEKEEAQGMLLEGIGECMKEMIDRKVKVVKGSPACIAGMALPASRCMVQPEYPQYMPVPPPFPGFSGNCPALTASTPACPRGIMSANPINPCFLNVARDVVGQMMGSLPPSAQPTTVTPTLNGWQPVPTAPTTRPVMVEPVPVQRPMPTSALPRRLPLGSPFPADVSGGIIPVSTLPPAQPVKLEVLSPHNGDPSRLVPVPMPTPAPKDTPPCEPMSD